METEKCQSRLGGEIAWVVRIIMVLMFPLESRLVLMPTSLVMRLVNRCRPYRFHSAVCQAASLSVGGRQKSNPKSGDGEDGLEVPTRVSSRIGNPLCVKEEIWPRMRSNVILVESEEI